MRENVVKNKSFAFAVRVVKIYQFLCEQKNVSYPKFWTIKNRKQGKV